MALTTLQDDPVNAMNESGEQTTQASMQEVIETLRELRQAQAGPEISQFMSVVKWLCGGGLALFFGAAVYLFVLGGAYQKIRSDIEANQQKTTLEFRLLKQELTSHGRFIDENKSAISRDILLELREIQKDIAVLKAAAKKDYK